MENLENMEEIEALQTELGLFLADMIPVPWKKICFYAECSPGTASTWFAFVEQETGVICTRGFFWNRYDTYKYPERAAVKRLLDYAADLYKAYVKKVGQDKVWSTMYYTLESDGAVHIDLEFELPSDNILEVRNAVYRKFFHTEPKHYDTKYPSKELK